MNIKLSRLNDISTITINSLSEHLNANEICFISARFYLFESEYGANFTDVQLISILHLFKGIYFEDIDLAEIFKVEPQLLICAFELSRSLHELDIAKFVTPYSAEGK
jgi:hypothetical protein|tara:strand:+ start:2647 stop:2967 length:321 start_codon:yes stop_codon:yes gene_type:complete